MFAVTEYTEATLATFTARVEKHGDDEKHGVSLGLQMRVGNATLDLIDPKLRETFYREPSDGEQLPGIEKALTVLRCNSIERATIPKRFDGWTLSVDDGIDDTTAKEFGGVKVDKLSIEPMQGGTVILRFRVGTSDIDAERSGMLQMRLGQSIWITLTPPAQGGQDSEPERDATDLFVDSAAD